MNKFVCRNWAQSENNFEYGKVENLERIWHFFEVQKCHKSLSKEKFSKPFLASSVYQVNELTCQISAESNKNFAVKREFLKILKKILKKSDKKIEKKKFLKKRMSLSGRGMRVTNKIISWIIH